MGFPRVEEGGNSF